MRSKAILPRRLCVVFSGLLAFVLVLLSGPVVSAAVTCDSLSMAALSSVGAKRSKIDDVLDSYSYFYCYQTSSHDIKLLDPTYRTLTYRNGYTRKYPDTPLYTIEKYPCPIDPTHNGLLKRFSCSYETY